MADRIPYTDDKVRYPKGKPLPPTKPSLPMERPVIPRGKPTPPVNKPGGGPPVDRPGRGEIDPVETPDKPTSGKSPGWGGKNPFPLPGPGNRPGSYPIKKRPPVMPGEPSFRNAARKKLMGMKRTDNG